MIIDILKNSEKSWRDIVRLATPLDSNKKVNIGLKPKLGDLEAYTNDIEIYINVDEKKFRDNFEKMIIPVYEPSADKLYSIAKKIQQKEFLENLVFDNFLFILFHEQLHPWLCPNSEQDRKKISKTLYEGIKEAQPSLSEAEVMMKVNNCKNLIWDTVLNISFLNKTSNNLDILANKIKFVFEKNNRRIDSQPISHYPRGILPILYIVSAGNRTTDSPISLVGSIYTTLSFNDEKLRQKAFDFFLQDLGAKKIPEKEVMELLKRMYKGFVDKLDYKELQERGIDKKEFEKRVESINDLVNSNYEGNQNYFISTLTQIFDTPSFRYDSLKGFIKFLSPYISLTEKQGSPDPNTMGVGGGAGGDGSEGEEDKKGKGKSQEEMDGDSISETLDDLIDELGGKEANDLMEDVANGIGVIGFGSGGGRGAGKPLGRDVVKRISIIATDEYYKKNSDVIEIRNPSEEMKTISVGDRKKWNIIRSTLLTSTEASRLNHSSIINFQKRTGLPVLVEAGSGFFKFNEYVLKTIPLKSYTLQKSGIEIPDNWVLIQDTSGTMTGYLYVGSKNRFDLLNRVKYGIQKGLYKICKELNKDLKFGIVNFSDATIYKGLDSLVKIHEAKSHPIKEISLTPQCGGTYCDSRVFKKIEKDLAPGKNIYTFITDGDLYGDTTPLYNEVERFSSQPNNSFVFVEIELSTNFGNQIKTLAAKNPSVLFYHVSDIKSIKDKLESILIKYS